MNQCHRFYALSNELRAETDPREIRMPLGTYAYGVADVDAGKGRTERREVVQQLDLEGARKIVAAVNSRRDCPGVPVYWGHPDVPAVAAKYPDKRAKGWVTHARLEPGTPAVLVLELGWWNESPKGGFGWFSPYWTGDLELTAGGGAVLHVSELLSVGLTNTPNIREFRLANEDNVEKPTKQETIMDLKKLIELLGLSPDADEEAVAAAIAKGKAALDAAAGAESAKADAETAAADAKTRAEAAEAEAEEARKKQQEAETALANERKARIGLVLDSAIASGHITPAARAAWEKRLGEDFDAGSVALANERQVKTKPVTSGLNPQDDARASAKLLELANERRAKTGCTLDEAWEYAKRSQKQI